MTKGSEQLYVCPKAEKCNKTCSKKLHHIHDEIIGEGDYCQWHDHPFKECPDKCIPVEPEKKEEKCELQFMVCPELLEKYAYVPNAVRIKIIDAEAIFLMGILGESGRKLVKQGIEFYFEEKLARKLIEKEIAIEVKGTGKAVGQGVEEILKNYFVKLVKAIRLHYKRVGKPYRMFEWINYWEDRRKDRDEMLQQLESFYRKEICGEIVIPTKTELIEYVRSDLIEKVQGLFREAIQAVTKKGEK